MLDDHLNFFYYIVLFAAYCFAGWVAEVIYRSVTQRKFVNAGFLFGPFLPIYGIGAFLVLALERVLQDWPMAVRFAAFGLVITLLEYSAGYLSEKIFKLKLWDYSEKRFNLHGYVCLSFSLLWTLLATGFALFVHPEAIRRAAMLPAGLVQIAAIVF
ncbi:MAG TPA: putative ABC transporter permease, partial [Smithellaceae bacterium]|nr:putative ABC transporter permease [Smithellaceae bacterium]HQN68182.1 putative ABC transporter permease [Smithellaceae bacterium]